MCKVKNGMISKEKKKFEFIFIRPDNDHSGGDLYSIHIMPRSGLREHIFLVFFLAFLLSSGGEEGGGFLRVRF